MGYPPIYKLPPPPYGLPTILKFFIPSLLSSYPVFWILIYKLGEGESNYHVIVQGGSKFWLPSPERGGSANQKKGWKYVARAGLLKRRGWLFSYLIFSRFIIFTFRNYFTLCKIVLCIWRKTIFFCHHNFMKKCHSKLSKNKPENIP